MSTRKDNSKPYSKGPRITRRDMLAGVAAATVAGISVPTVASAKVQRVVENDRINQSVSRWCYGKLSLDELCAAAAKMGIKSVELLDIPDLPTVKKHGLV